MNPNDTTSDTNNQIIPPVSSPVGDESPSSSIPPMPSPEPLASPEPLEIKKEETQVVLPVSSPNPSSALTDEPPVDLTSLKNEQ